MSARTHKTALFILRQISMQVKWLCYTGQYLMAQLQSAHQKFISLICPIKGNLASDFWISTSWFLGQTAVQMKFAK